MPPVVIKVMETIIAEKTAATKVMGTIIAGQTVVTKAMETIIVKVRDKAISI